MRSTLNVIQLASNISENETNHRTNDSITSDDLQFTSNSDRSHTGADENEANQNSIDPPTFDDIDGTNSEIDSDLDDDNFCFEEYCHLHSNTKCTVSDAMLMIHAYSVRHDLSWTAIDDLIRLVNRVVGEKKIPQSKYLFKQKFVKSIKCNPVKHFVCHQCNLYLGTLEQIKSEGNEYCTICQCKIQTDTKYAKNHFVTIPIREQLTKILERNSDNLIFNTQRSTTHICDVHDALLFQRMENIITLTFSSDGAAVFKATQEKSLWPLQFIANEIDLEHRFQRSNMFCSVISFGATPNMQTYLKPFIEEVKQINAERNGLSFKMKSGEIKKFTIVPMIFTGDALAKQYVFLTQRVQFIT